MQKIAIIGSPGSGKSTLARELGAILRLPIHHLDTLYWRSGWQPMARPDWEALQANLVEQERWIIDGNYRSTLPIRIGAADTVIFIDLPRSVCLWRAIRRVFQYRGHSRPDMAEGCEERIDRQFLAFIWGYPEKERPRVLQLLEGVRPPRQVIHLSSIREIEAFRRRLTGRAE